MIKLEHANICCTSIDAMTRFLIAAAPGFRIRGEGSDGQGRPWRHVGDDTFYLALTEGGAPSPRTPYDNQAGLNHLGWEVDDVSALQQRMADAGFPANLTIDDHPARRRRYFYDPDGNDWEFVEYTTDAIAERNDYSDSR